jgi:hypothetical protein
MFGRMVTIGDREIWVNCTPKTPLSDVLRRASEQLKKEELDAAALHFPQVTDTAHE